MRVNPFFCSKLAVFCVAVVVILLPHSATAGFDVGIAVTTYRNSDGSYLYNYLITDKTSSSFNLEGFSMTLPSNANLQLLSGPNGWDYSYSSGDTEVVFEAYLDDFVILPGAAGSFSFTSFLAPTLLNVDIGGIDNTGQNISDYITQVLGPGASPSVVPEPSSMIPLSIGLVTFAGYFVYRKRSQ